jgi:hypothetical protein
MAHSWHHAVNSARKYGGKPEDYIELHNWMDGSKAHLADFRHRALRHHTEGIFMLEQVFGVTITNSDGKNIPVRFIGEQHVKEDLGRIPTVADWLLAIKPESWMLGARKDLAKALEETDGFVRIPDRTSSAPGAACAEFT